ncbi:MAG: hypothetical protein JO276_04800 [Sphingomonadaceae bacterium]|nr:hypothetical protein [Sphingomonadaceae bacterium]
MMDAAEQRRADRIAGGALIAGAMLSVLVMAHHPEHVDPNGIVGLVHGAMLTLMTIIFYGFAHFALRRGVARPPILAGLICYAIGVVADLGAGTTNGFIVPALAAHGSVLSGRDVFLLAWEANQALARLGVFATAAAFVFWSLDFLRRPGFEAKAIGALGLIAGIGPASLLISGVIDMHVAGAFLAYAAFALWGVLVGFHLVRGGLGQAGAEA